VKADGQSHHHKHEYHLEYAYPEMPLYGNQSLEINLAEGYKEYQKHEQRQYCIENGRKESGGIAEKRHKCEYEIDNSPNSHRHWQYPIPDKFDYTHFLVALFFLAINMALLSAKLYKRNDMSKLVN